MFEKISEKLKFKSQKRPKKAKLFGHFQINLPKTKFFGPVTSAT